MVTSVREGSNSMVESKDHHSASYLLQVQNTAAHCILVSESSRNTMQSSTEWNKLFLYGEEID